MNTKEYICCWSSETNTGFRDWTFRYRFGSGGPKLPNRRRHSCLVQGITNFTGRCVACALCGEPWPEGLPCSAYSDTITLYRPPLEMTTTARGRNAERRRTNGPRGLLNAIVQKYMTAPRTLHLIRFLVAKHLPPNGIAGGVHLVVMGCQLLFVTVVGEKHGNARSGTRESPFVLVRQY